MSDTGYKNQVRTQRYLESNGWVVHTVRRPSYKGQSHDLFGLWDHVCQAKQDMQFYINGGYLSVRKGSTLFVQTKSRKIYGKDRERYLSFPGFGIQCVWEKKENGRYDKEPFMDLLTLKTNVYLN